MDRNFPQSMETQPCDKCQRVTCSTLHSNTNLTNCFPKGCDICLERVKIDAEIANLEDRLFKLANKRLEITQNLNSRHDRLITRLPIELVSRIFMFAAESNVVEYFEADRPFAWHPSILLNAVSKGWRNVALSTPQLWTSIIIDLSIDHLKTDITTEWLGRSRALPISITFKSHSLDKSNADYLNLLNIIQSHSTRWKCVHFSNWSFDNGLLEGLQGPHLLDSLTIDLAMGSYHNNSFSMTSLPNEKLLAPKNFDARYCSLARLPLRWDSLTHLEVALITVDEVLQVICHASRITHLTERLALLPPGKSFPLPTTPIVNYALQCLTIHSTEFSQGANLLQYITLPLLRNFDYSFKNQEGTLDILIGFLDRSQAPLDDFVFAFPVTAPNQLPHHGHWFERLPQITQLKLFLDSTLNESKWLDTFFITLNYDNDQNASLVLPKLRRLDISAPKLSRLSWSLFSCIFPRPEYSNFVSSNNGGGRPLKFVEVEQMSFTRDREDYRDHDDDDEEEEEEDYEDEDEDEEDEEAEEDNTGHGGKDEDNGDMIMDKKAYELLIAAQKSGISLKLTAADGSDVLSQVAKFSYDENMDI